MSIKQALQNAVASAVKNDDAEDTSIRSTMENAFGAIAAALVDNQSFTRYGTGEVVEFNRLGFIQKFITDGICNSSYRCLEVAEKQLHTLHNEAKVAVRQRDGNEISEVQLSKILDKYERQQEQVASARAIHTGFEAAFAVHMEKPFVPYVKAAVAVADGTTNQAERAARLLGSDKTMPAKRSDGVDGEAQDGGEIQTDLNHKANRKGDKTKAA